MVEVSGDQELNKLPGVTALSLFYMIRTKLPMALDVIRKKKEKMKQESLEGRNMNWVSA